METFAKLFARFLVFVYHCFDRIVIQGYLPLLTRPEHIVYFFRDVHGQYPITPPVLAQRTLEYRGWVEGYARNHKIPILKAEKGKSKEDCVRPYLQRMERRNQHGVYCIFTSMEMGSTFRTQMPKYPTDDPDYRLIRRVPSRYLHYYFYIRDPVIGPLAMCVGTYLPFQTTYYLNGHNFIEIELRRQTVAFRKDHNAFLSTSDPKALQMTADQLSASTIEQRLNYWTWFLGPKFPKKDRQGVNLRRAYSINQIEYCRNFIFKRHFPIHKIFEHSCEMGLFRLAADKVAYIFGVRVTTFVLPATAYTLTQLRYDLRKMKAHGLVERIGEATLYRLTDQGVKAALMFILFHQRVCGPLANSLFHHRPDETLKPDSKIETAFHKADHAIQRVIDLLAA